MKKKILSMMLVAAMAVGMMAGCGSSSDSGSTAEGSDSSKKVLRVGMECAYAPFNWTQETEDVANGDKAVPIYGTNYYAYGYDVMMAKKLADELGWELEIHKVEWDSIGMAMDSGEYDCIIAGQREGALALGMSPMSAMFHVILPQAFKNIIPEMANTFLTNLKMTSVLNVIGVSELFMMAKTAGGTYYKYFESYLVIAIIYLVLCIIFNRLFLLIEKKMAGKKDYVLAVEYMDEERKRVNEV